MRKPWFRRIAVSPPEVRDWEAWARAAARNGADALMIRGASNAEAVVQSLSGYGLPLLYNGPPPPPRGVVAMHWKSSSPPTTQPEIINGRSCHTLHEVQAAQATGYDYVFFSPVFATRSHPDAPAHGTQVLQSVCRTCVIPVFALGGIDRSNEMLCLAAGAFGIAGISRFLDDVNPNDQMRPASHPCA
ncbi:MAG: thiamine phosphate synthase [Bacteroidia bacterium]|nr:thiamine phosphate synthase [Bacteroidia bacterium]MDW8334283.1 thiamine phosphate synthase [Bacteroidia bacterium]